MFWKIKGTFKTRRLGSLDKYVRMLCGGYDLTEDIINFCFWRIKKTAVALETSLDKVAWQEYRSLRTYSDINCMALISPLRQSSSLQQHDSEKLILTLNATRNFDSFPIAKQSYNIIMAHMQYEELLRTYVHHSILGSGHVQNAKKTALLIPVKL